MGVFVMRQGRIPNPLLNLKPMCNRLFAPMCALVVVAMMTTFSMSMLLPLYFEGALGTTALAAGALLLAPILVNAVTSLVGGRIMDKRGSWPLLPAGFAVITVGQLAVCLCAPTLSLAGVLVASVVVYAGVGLVLSPSQTAGLQTLSPEQNPHGVAILNTFIQIAAAVGPSLFIGVLSSVAGSVEAAGTAAAACAIAAAGTLTALALCPQAPTSRRGANDWRAGGGSSGRWWHCRRDGYLRQHDAHPRPCGHSSTSPDLRFGI